MAKKNQKQNKPNTWLILVVALTMTAALAIPFVQEGKRITGLAVSDEDTVLMLHFDPSDSKGEGTITDSSQSDHQVSLEGDTTLSTSTYKIGGGSAYLDGENDYIEIPNSEDFDLDGDFTIDFWWKDDTVGADMPIISKTDGPSASPFLIHDIPDGNTRRLCFYATSNLGNTWDMANCVDMGEVSRTEFVHYAVVRKGNKFITFRNGKAKAIFYTTMPLMTNTKPVRISGSWNSAPATVRGYIDEVRITKGKALWDAEFNSFIDSEGRTIFIQGDDSCEASCTGGVCKNGICVKEEKDPIFLLKSSSASEQTLQDQSKHKYYGRCTFCPKMSANTYEFDGATTSVSYGNNLNVTHRESRSFSFWIRDDAQKPSAPVISKTWGCGNNGQFAIYSASSGVTFSYVDVNGAYPVFRGPASEIGRWNHYVITYTYGDGTSAKMYKNGDLVPASWVSGNGASVVSNKYYNTGDLTLGKFGTCTNPMYFFDGALKDVAIYNRIISSDEVKALYKSGYVVTTPSYPSGSCDVSIDYFKFSGKSSYTIDDSESCNFDSSDFTIDFWYKESAKSTGFANLMKKGNSLLLQTTPTIVNVRKSCFSLSTTGNSYYINCMNMGGAPADEWRHFAVIRSGNAVSTYENGKTKTGMILSQPMYGNSQPIVLGGEQPSGVVIDSEIRNLRITKGTARWTKDFTPPACKGCQDIVAECTDSDGGRVYNIKGETQVANWGSEDCCYSSNKATGICVTEGLYLKEAYCIPPNETDAIPQDDLYQYSQTIQKNEIYKCPNGCKDGACVESEGSSRTVSFYLASDKYTFEDTNIENRGMGSQRLKQFSENVDDTLINITGTDDGSTITLNSIVIDWSGVRSSNTEFPNTIYANVEDILNGREYAEIEGGSISTTKGVSDYFQRLNPTSYILIFENPLKVSVPKSGTKVEDMIGLKINILGTWFTITDAQRTAKGRIKIEIAAIFAQGTLKEGESKTYTKDGKNYDTQVIIITTSYAMIKVNGEVTTKLYPPYSYRIREGTLVGVTGLGFAADSCIDKCGDGTCQERVCMSTGCDCAETKESCPEDCATSSSTQSTSGLSINFGAGSPPEEVYDGGDFPFDIEVQLNNYGNYKIPRKNAQVKITGISPADFGVSESDLIKNPNEDIEATVFDSEGHLRQSPTVYVEFADLNKRSLVDSKTDYKIKAEVCYLYETDATTKLCIKTNNLDTSDSVCKVNGEKTLQVSGAPIQVAGFNEIAAAKDKVIFSFFIQKTANGDLYKMDSFCDDSTDNKDRVWIEIATNVEGLSCNPLQYGTATSGYLTLYNGKRTVTCSQTIQTSSNYEAPVDIVIKYKWKDTKETSLIVKPSVNSIPESCVNNIKDNDEQGIDCGGSCPDGCAEGCASIENNGQRNNCYLNLAKETGQESYCSIISDDYIKEACMMILQAQEEDGNQDCSNKENQDQKDSCYLNLAKETGQESYCSIISDEYIKEACYTYFGHPSTPTTGTCASGCDDQNSCTTDFCESAQCKHSLIRPCCGNGFCESSESHSTCPADCTITQEPGAPSCSGCSTDGKCVPIGGRYDEQYCDIDYSLKAQLGGEGSCQNDYECITNSCIDGQCIEPGFFRRLIRWLGWG